MELNTKFLFMTYFADVILPLPLGKYFTYAIPNEIFPSIKVGSRVIVQFGAKKFYTAIVRDIHGNKPEYETKDILEVLDAKPIIRPRQLEFWEWIANYYMCSVGDVYKAALPSGLKPESETTLQLNEECCFDESNHLTPKERLIVEFLSKEKEASIATIEKSGIKGVMSSIKLLLERNIIAVKEELRRKYQPKTQLCIKLAFEGNEQEKIRECFELLKGAKKQLKLFVTFLEMSAVSRGGQETIVSRNSLLERADVNSSVLLAMINRGIFVQYKQEINRFDGRMSKVEKAHELNPAQNKAYNEIIDCFCNKDITLLRGVTSSGKTEIYIHLIKHAIEEGKQVLFLVPEIALTTQLANRLARVFGNKLGVYHSKFNDNERVDIWNSLLQDNGIQVVLGVRSSLFLPFKNLGLIIVDEEHETSYKQQDPAPRYNARNAAMILASSFRAKTLLGSATPSIESYYNAKIGKYGLVELLTRHGDIMLPKIEIADTRELRRKKIMTSGDISPQLAEASKSVLDMGGQVILFRNRRGFAPIVECDTCGWTPKCKHCDVTMTYHKHLNQLTCHYCGYTYEIPKKCPACGYHTIETKGFGTEHIEEESANQFKGYPVARMDLDTTRSRKAYEEIISDFESGKTRVLIGTQMITKGLDFERVGVVGILGADSLLNMPDFRAYERAFQMMEQVAGRAGRKGKQGRVIVQTSQADHPIIKQLLTHDYVGMFNEQLTERRDFSYPPFSRLIYIYIKGRNEDSVQRASRWYADLLRQVFGGRVLGPDKPVIGRVQSMYIRKIVLKLENNASPKKVRDIISAAEDNFYAQNGYKSLILYYDADPM